MFALTDKNRDYLREWLPWVDGARTVEDTREFIKGSLEQFAANEGFSAGSVAQGRDCRGNRISQDRLAESQGGDWVLDQRRVPGKGIVTRAARAVVNYSFNELGLNRVEIHCAEGTERAALLPSASASGKKACCVGPGCFMINTSIWWYTEC